MVLLLAPAPQSRYRGRTFRLYQNWHALPVAFVNPETNNTLSSSIWHISCAICFGILFALNIPLKKGG
jgi:hypothetical protein